MISNYKVCPSSHWGKGKGIWHSIVGSSNRKIWNDFIFIALLRVFNTLQTYPGMHMNRAAHLQGMSRLGQGACLQGQSWLRKGVPSSPQLHPWSFLNMTLHNPCRNKNLQYRLRSNETELNWKELLASCLQPESCVLLVIFFNLSFCTYKMEMIKKTALKVLWGCFEKKISLCLLNT